MERVDDLFSDYANHPIPSVSSLDVHAVWEDGTSHLHVVIASPLRIDDRSRERLMTKLMNYLNFVASAEFRLQHGEPSLERTWIVVDLHPDMDVRGGETLRLCEEWINSYGASLKIQYLNRDLSPPQGTARRLPPNEA
jgi:hypothetical protein